MELCRVNDLLDLKLLNTAGEMSSLKLPAEKSVRTLFVGGPDIRVTEPDLTIKSFAHGEMESIKMDIDKAFAVLTHTTQQRIEKAAEELFNELVIRGFMLNLKLGKPQYPRQQLKVLDAARQKGAFMHNRLSPSPVELDKQNQHQPNGSQDQPPSLQYHDMPSSPKSHQDMDHSSMAPQSMDDPQDGENKEFRLVIHGCNLSDPDQAVTIYRVDFTSKFASKMHELVTIDLDGEYDRFNLLLRTTIRIGSSLFYVGGTIIASSSVDKLRLDSGLLSRSIPLSVARRLPRAALLRGKLFVFSCALGWEKVSPWGEYLDLNSGCLGWSALPEPLSRPSHGNLSCVVLELLNKLVLIDWGRSAGFVLLDDFTWLCVSLPGWENGGGGGVTPILAVSGSIVYCLSGWKLKAFDFLFNKWSVCELHGISHPMTAGYQIIGATCIEDQLCVVWKDSSNILYLDRFKLSKIPSHDTVVRAELVAGDCWSLDSTEDFVNCTFGECFNLLDAQQEDLVEQVEQLFEDFCDHQ